MSINPKECPYFIQAKRQMIICKGFEDGCEIRQGFPVLGEESEYQAQFCYYSYHRCKLARMLNPIWKQIDDTPCPYNDGVECLHKDKCNQCGWNPVVSQERLERRFPSLCIE